MQVKLNRRTGFAIAILLATFGTASQAEETRETEQIKLTDGQLADLPLGASVKLSDPPAANFDIGKVFAYEQARGRISLHNDSASEITLGEVSTSCGCAGAVPTDKKIAAGQTAHLIINYLAGAPGGKSVMIGATVSGKRFELIGKSSSLAHLVAEPNAVRVVDGRARVRLKVVDTRIDLHQAKITIKPPLFAVAARVSKDAVDCEITTTQLSAVLPDSLTIIVNGGSGSSGP